MLPFLRPDQVIATGCKLTEPSTLPGSTKLDGVEYLKRHAQKVRDSKKVVLIGAGAVGVQMATDIKELYPEKSVTLIHSRAQLMNRFHSKLHDLVEERAHELGVDLVLGSRVKLPEGGYPTDGREFQVELQDGRKVDADFAVGGRQGVISMKCKLRHVADGSECILQIICTGQTPQSEVVQQLSPSSIDKSGFINTKKTLQIADSSFPNIFVVGDIANSGAPKAARP